MVIYLHIFYRNVVHLKTDSNLFLRNDDIIDTDVDDMLQFWEIIKSVMNPDGSEKYKELTKLVEICLSLPHNSANYERIFSTITLNKTKIRNKLSTETLSAILYSKTIRNQNCFDYKISPDLLKKHTGIYH